MKNQITTALFCLISLCSFATAIDTLEVSSTIKEVTVFFSGAEVSRQVPLKLSKGKYLLVLNELPQEINPQSIQVSSIPKVSILAVKHEFHIPDEDKKDARIKELGFLIEQVKKQLSTIADNNEVLSIEEQLLPDNSVFQQQNNKVSVSEIREAADFYRARITEIRTKKRLLEGQYVEQIDLLKAHTAQLNELRAYNRKSYSKIVVAVNCTKQISDAITVSYFINSAGWEPLYDFRVKDITEPLEIVYQANVYQASGEDWNQVDITLTTGNPELTGEKPDLKKWILGKKPNYNSVDNEMSSGIGSIKGIVMTEESDEPLAFVNVVVSQNGQMVNGGVTDFDGRYYIKLLQTGYYDVSVKSVGFKPEMIKDVRVSKDKLTFLNIALDSGVSLDEVEIVQYTMPLINKDGGASGGNVVYRNDIAALPKRSIAGIASTVGGVNGYNNESLNVRGARTEPTYHYVDGVKTHGRTTENLIGNSIKTGVTNLSFKIDIPYNIPSDGEQYGIRIKSTKLPVNYVYHLVPKLESDAFLNAEITNWEDLNLLSGKMSVYYQGTFTGESFLDMEQTNDTLQVSLGRDKSVIALRNFNKEMNDKRVVGSYIKEIVGVEIELKNNKATEVQVVIEDQVPVSDRKSMGLEVLNISGAKYNERTGMLIWKTTIPAQTKLTKLIKYEAKYPKYARLGLE
jgi:hypothetical protein